MSRPTENRLNEARSYALNMAQGRTWEVTTNGWAAHLAGSAQVWICPSCLTSTPGYRNAVNLTCRCRAVLAP